MREGGFHKDGTVETPAGYVWMIWDGVEDGVAPIAGEDRGDEVVVTNADVGVNTAGFGDAGLRVLPSGRTAKIVLRTAAVAQTAREARDLKKDRKSSGPLVLELRAMPGTSRRGRPFMDVCNACPFMDVCNACQEVPTDGFPLDGPRIGSWCLGFPQRKNRNTLEHHFFWQNVLMKVPDDSNGVEFHLLAHGPSKV